MKTAMEVFTKIKELSKKNVNPQHRILIDDLRVELSMQKENLIVLINELENKFLVKTHHGTVSSVSLTNYGISQEDLTGWSDK